MWSRLKNRQLWLASNLLGFLTMFCSNWLMFYYSQQRFLEQHSIVATLLQMVATLFQYCNAVLRWKSLLRIVSCNVALKRRRRGRDNRELKQRRRRRQRERQKSNWLRLVKQQLCTCITLFYTFLCRRCTTTTWKCLISRFVENVKTKQRLASSFRELCSLLEFNCTEICQHLTNWTSWNKRDKIWSGANSLFKFVCVSFGSINSNCA